MENRVQLFEKQQVRAVWDEENEKWWFSVQDVVTILTDTVDAKDYIKKMKKRDPELNSNWGTICPLVEMPAADGKKRKIQAADLNGIFRIIQSIPSPKAEPFKMWLAKVGRERIDETIDPELSIDRAIQNYRRLGYSENWINQRIKSIEV
ncbi:MAG: Bro-N domain-containing protein, partial [Paludibacter sp.]|nr:Bro-N domain-containing protein [Paludibacter sp.]